MADLLPSFKHRKKRKEIKQNKKETKRDEKKNPAVQIWTSHNFSMHVSIDSLYYNPNESMIHP